MFEQQVLVLRVHINQHLAQFFHLCQRSGSIVDKSTALARSIYLAPQDALVLIFQVVGLEKWLHAISGYFETGFDDTLRSSPAYSLYVGTLPQQQADGSQNNRFSGTRFACNHRKAVFQPDIELFDQRIILYVK